MNQFCPSPLIISLNHAQRWLSGRVFEMSRKEVKPHANHLSKGFTLIELLVVIAILGILAAVVLVAINPAERIKEANDTKVRSAIGDAATAATACFTNNASGVYTNCKTAALLNTGGYTKTVLSGVTPVAKVSPADTEIKWYGTLTAASAGACVNTNYLVWDSATNATTIVCSASAPTYP